LERAYLAEKQGARFEMAIRLAFVAAALTLCSVAAQPVLEEPIDGSSTVMQNPHLSWTPTCPITADPSVNCANYTVQISESPDFKLLVVDETVPVILTRFVVLNPLGFGTYYWRVGSPSTTWSDPSSFAVVRPSATIEVAVNASFAEMQEAFAAAALQPSTLVHFDPNMGERQLDPGNETVFLSLLNASEVVVDFSGAHLTFTKFVRFVSLEACVRVTVRNLTVDLDPLPYTALHVESIDALTSSFVGTLAAKHPSIESLGAGDQHNMGEVMDGATTRTKRGLIEGLMFQPNFTRLSASKYQIVLAPLQHQKTDELMGGIEAGDVFVIGQRTGPGELTAPSVSLDPDPYIH
jgi:hypothetical protein